MKKIIPTFLLFFFLSIQLSSQTEFAPPGATWSYTFQTYWTNFNGFLVLRYEKDTVLSGIPCKKLSGAILDSAYVKVDNHDVYVRQSGDSIFSVFGENSYYVFKNNFQLNETAVFNFLWNSPLTVSAIETLTFGGQTTKKYVLDSDGPLFDQTAIYEKFGPELGFFQSWWGVAVDGFSYRLLCYKDDGFPLAELGNGPCFGLTAATAENAPAEASLTVFPNPASNALRFDFQGKAAPYTNLAVWDVTGKAVIRTLLPAANQLDITALPSGMYYGNVFNADSVLPFKFIKR